MEEKNLSALSASIEILKAAANSLSLAQKYGENLLTLRRSATR